MNKTVTEKMEKLQERMHRLVIGGLVRLTLLLANTAISLLFLYLKLVSS